MERNNAEALFSFIVWFGPAFVAGGILMRAIGLPSGTAVAALGLLISMVAMAMARKWNSYRRIGDLSGGVEYDRRRSESGFQVAALTLNLLLLLTLVVLLTGVASRAGFASRTFSLTTQDRVASLLTMPLAFALATSFHMGLKNHRMSKPNGFNLFSFWAAQGAGLLLAGMAILAMFTDINAAGRAIVKQGDTLMFLLGAQGIIALGTIGLRNIPSLTSALSSQRDEAGEGGLSSKSVLLPTLIAFSLLFVVAGVLVAYGVGFLDLFTTLGSNPWLLALVVLIIIGFIATVALAFYFSRSGDPEALVAGPSTQDRTRDLLLAISGSLAALTAVFSLFLKNGVVLSIAAADHWFDVLVVATLIAIGPYGWYMARLHRRDRLLEERFPDFLRDLASSHKGGLTLYSAVEVAARGDYGFLSPEIRKMADQLSWNISFEEALERFSERVDTPLVVRAINLILEASRSGGSTTAVLLAAARDAREIKTLENERRLTMSIYLMIIYITFGVFLVVAAVLYGQFVPEILAANEAAADLGQSSVGGLNFHNAISLADYRTFYFAAAVVQGLGDGIIGGLMGHGRAVMGLRHSFLMVATALVVFLVI